MDKHQGFLPGDQVKVVDHWNSRKPQQLGVVIEVVPGDGITWRWAHECERI